MLYFLVLREVLLYDGSYILGVFGVVGGFFMGLLIVFLLSVASFNALCTGAVLPKLVNGSVILGRGSGITF